MTAHPNPINAGPDTLRLVWPQWQGAGSEAVREMFPGPDLETARRAYAVGADVLQAILPRHAGPTEIVPTPPGSSPASSGVESRPEILQSLASAQAVIRRHAPARIITLGGECSVSVVPFCELAARYGDDLAVLWVDSHPDTDTPNTGYDGFHAMAVSAITGHGDPEVLEALPAFVDPRRVALVGTHEWQDDAHAHVDEWGIAEFGPEVLRTEPEALLSWLRATGATKVAIHLDVDVVDSNEIVLGLGQVPDGLRTGDVRAIIQDVAGVADVVGLTVAEFIPRQVVGVLGLLRGLPLLGA